MHTTSQLHSHINQELETVLLLLPTHSTRMTYIATTPIGSSQAAEDRRANGLREWKGEAEARQTKKQRTVVDLSAELRGSRRKRPLSFDCELNHVVGAILK